MKKISCVIAAYNEEKLIGKVLETAIRAEKEGLISEIIVVSDGSTDKTADLAKIKGADNIIVLDKNNKIKI